MEPRNLFTTKTLQGAFLMVLGFAIAIAPIMPDFIDRKFPTKTAEDIKFYLGVLALGGGFIRTSTGRYAATDDVYTPMLIPGRNKDRVAVSTNVTRENID